MNETEVSLNETEVSLNETVVSLKCSKESAEIEYQYYFSVITLCICTSHLIQSSRKIENRNATMFFFLRFRV